MAVACGILVKIVLKILLGRIEVLQRKLFDNQRLRTVFLLFGKHLFNDGQILVMGIVDTRAYSSFAVGVTASLAPPHH